MEKHEIEDALKKVKTHETNSIDVVEQVLPGGKTQGEIVLTHKRLMPERMESPPRKHIFHDVAGFKAFLESNKTENTIVFADVECVTIFAILDDEAEYGFEIVTLEPPYHPEFILLNETLLNQILPIADFAQGVMRNRKIITTDSRQSAQSIALIMQQIVISSETTQFIGDGKVSVNGLITTTKVTAGGPEAKSQIKIPDSFEVEVPIYINTDAAKFGVDITISTKHGDVLAIVDCPELESKKYEVFQIMMAGITKLKGVSVVYGRPSVGGWNYNK